MIVQRRMGLIGEFERHHGTIAMFPFRNDIWRDDAVHMQKYILDLVSVISKYEPVFLFCQTRLIDKIRNIPNNVTIINSEYDDIWARDIGPTFVYNNGKAECIDWKFNAWGGKKEGAYFPWDADDNFASAVSSFFGLTCNRINIVLEGGGIISDGNGTLFTTRSVLLNRNRNPFKKRDFIEEEILKATHDKQIIWIDQGLAYDETNGHIDNLLSFVNNNELCLAWTEDKHNPNYRRIKKAFDILSNITNTDGDKYKIHLIPLPPMQYMDEKESNGLRNHPEALPRNAGDALPASYLNYYIINGAVLIPSFGCDTDEYVKTMFENIFPERDIIQVYSREPLLGGGGIHCLLHEVPLMEDIK
ncbi:MAG: agmatine deiminase family protein [Lachnospiraceae bacterium]|nr:agmatine deiminase family protein [Lachnospiraceae bacterium]MBD5498849.1 agmatine deiminase family protein [Lachnospiraceae bacterium]